MWLTSFTLEQAETYRQNRVHEAQRQRRIRRARRQR